MEACDDKKESYHLLSNILADKEYIKFMSY